MHTIAFTSVFPYNFLEIDKKQQRSKCCPLSLLLQQSSLVHKACVYVLSWFVFNKQTIKSIKLFNIIAFCSILHKINFCNQTIDDNNDDDEQQQTGKQTNAIIICNHKPITVFEFSSTFVQRERERVREGESERKKRVTIDSHERNNDFSI